jgi:DHA2 family multidrug resistance protein-like MFS transporter
VTEPGPPASRRTWIGLAVLALPCLLYSMDLTVLNLAVPHIVADLAPSSAQQLWIVDIYGFVIAGALIPMGNLGDRIGRRRLLLIGAAAFGAASIVAACATSAAMLIASRAALGLAGATLAPSTLAMIRTMFVVPQQRAFAIGVWVASFSAGAAIGPLLGGAMLERFWWGSVFLLAVPVMALLLLVGRSLLPEVREARSEAAGPLDFASAAMALVAVLLVIFGFKQIAQHGVAPGALVAIAAGLAVGAAFVRRQRTLRHPLVDLRLLRTPSFVGALSTYALAAFVLFGIYVALAQYLQLVFELSPLQAGLWTVPASLGMIAASLLAPAIAQRARPVVVIVGGLVVASIGLGIGALGGFAGVITGSVLLSLGASIVPALATDMIVSSVPEAQAGAASGLAEASAELGGALGIALLGSLGLAIYRGALPSDVPASADTFARATVLASQPPAPWLAHARDAFIDSFAAMSLAGVAVLLATAALAIALLRDRAAPQPVVAAAGRAPGTLAV